MLYKISLITPIIFISRLKTEVFCRLTFKHIMFVRISFLLVYLSISAIAVVKDEEPKSFIKLTFGVSKATYLPLESSRFLKNGQIMENPSFTGSQDIPEDDKASCIIGGWTANSNETLETEVI